MTEDDFKEFKVLEFIEVEPDKLVWDDTGTGTWMSGPPVCIFDQIFFDSWSERFQRNTTRETAWYWWDSDLIPKFTKRFEFW